MVKTHELSASLEDYLEAIFHIEKEKGASRAKDISKRLNVNSSSVTGALRVLAERALINYAPYDLITLTPEGRKAAEDVIRRHEVLRDFFVKVLAIEEGEAEEGACKMEHAVPGLILERLIQYIDFLETCPRCGTELIRGFENFCGREEEPVDCEDCTSRCLEEIKQKRETAGILQTMLTLEGMKPGQKAKIIRIQGQDTLNKRIVDMGIAPGTVIEVESVALPGDPIDVKAKGYHFSLRREEAAVITVEIT